MTLFARSPMARDRALNDPATAAALRRYRRRSRALLAAAVSVAGGALLLAAIIQGVQPPAAGRSATVGAARAIWELLNLILGVTIGAACLASVLGAVMCVRVHRLRRLLARWPWRQARYRCFRTSGRSLWPVLVWFDHLPSATAAPLVVRFALTWSHRLDPWQRSSTGVAWLAGEPGRPMVLAMPGLHEGLYPVRAGRLAWTRRHWADAFQRHGGLPAERCYDERRADERSLDSLPFDERPEYCWRCDAVPASHELGLCERCFVDLRVRQRADASSDYGPDVDPTAD